MSRYCLAKPACNVSGCTRRHHFLLHTEFGDSRPASSSAATRGSSHLTPQQSQGSTSNFSGATVTKSANTMCLNVVPVKISSGSKTVLSYAFLDQGSTATLCDDRLLDLLQITGKPAKFAISTVNERADIHRDSKVNLTINSLALGKHLNLLNVLSNDCQRYEISPWLKMSCKPGRISGTWIFVKSQERYCCCQARRFLQIFEGVKFNIQSFFWQILRFLFALFVCSNST